MVKQGNISSTIFCPNPAACPGGISTNFSTMCAPGYEGQACAYCRKGYAISDSSVLHCTPCETEWWRTLLQWAIMLAKHVVPFAVAAHSALQVEGVEVSRIVMVSCCVPRAKAVEGKAQNLECKFGCMTGAQAQWCAHQSVDVFCHGCWHPLDRGCPDQRISGSHANGSRSDALAGTVDLASTSQTDVLKDSIWPSGSCSMQGRFSSHLS